MPGTLSSEHDAPHSALQPSEHDNTYIALHPTNMDFSFFPPTNLPYLRTVSTQLARWLTASGRRLFWTLCAANMRDMWFGVSAPIPFNWASSNGHLRGVTASIFNRSGWKMRICGGNRVRHVNYEHENNVTHESCRISSPESESERSKMSLCAPVMTDRHGFIINKGNIVVKNEDNTEFTIADVTSIGASPMVYLLHDSTGSTVDASIVMLTEEGKQKGGFARAGFCEMCFNHFHRNDVTWLGDAPLNHLGRSVNCACGTCLADVAQPQRLENAYLRRH